jgi:multiple sugar transport system permease protein
MGFSIAARAEREFGARPRKRAWRNDGEAFLRNSVVVAIACFYSAFVIYPIAKALAGSFHKWNPLNGQYDFIGAANYAYALSDGLFWSSMLNNLIFTTAVVALRVALGLWIALLLAGLSRFRDLFQTLFFIPVISSLVAIAYVWKWMYDPNIGLINEALGLLGMQGSNWLMDPATAMPAVIVMTVWKDSGYAVVIFLAGLLNLSRDIFEAAEIDGASKARIFFRITWPLLNRTTVFVVVTSLISYLQSFAQIFVMTSGGPGTRTFITTYQIFTEAFVNYNFGYASSISFMLFLVIIVLTLIQFRAMKGEGEEI